VTSRVTLLLPTRYHDRHLAGMARLQTRGSTRRRRTAGLGGTPQGGSEFPLSLSASEWQVAGETFVTAIIHDITERKAASGEIERLNRMYFVSSHVSQAIVPREEPGRRCSRKSARDAGVRSLKDCVDRPARDPGDAVAGAGSSWWRQQGYVQAIGISSIPACLRAWVQAARPSGTTASAYATTSSPIRRRCRGVSAPPAAAFSR